MLLYQSDLRSVFFMMLTTALLVTLWTEPLELNFIFAAQYLGLLMLAIVASVMTHNHQHLPMWRSKWMNGLTDIWLTLFYGFPIFVWIPTHNINHHKYINKLPDDTRTYRFSEKNNLLTLLTYPTVSAYFQQKPIREYLRALKTKNRSKYYLAWLQIICLATWIIGAVVMDWRRAVLFIIIPQQLSMYAVLIFNYLQHVHADEEDPFNNSRNFTGSIMNYILLNNGYHTAHHLYTSLHWSRLPEKHQELMPKIDPALNETNLANFLFRTYILGVFSARMRSNSLRLARLEKEATQ